MKIVVFVPGRSEWENPPAPPVPGVLESSAEVETVELGGDVDPAKAARGADAAVLTDPFAVGPRFAKMPCPMMVNYRPLMWHAYDAQARTFFREHGMPVLPSDSEESLKDSLTALAARSRLGTEKALVFASRAKGTKDGAGAEDVGRRLGLEMEVRDVEDLKARAAEVAEEEARDVLARWREEAFGRVDPNLSEAHLVGVARLYVAEKALAAAAGATALTVEEFGPFLFRDEPMPNVTYALLKNEGILTAEEADATALATQMVLRALTGEPNTMGNVYLAWRDAYESLDAGLIGKHRRLDSAAVYTPELERRDWEQCLAEGTAVVSHFGTAGALPHAMMEGTRYDVVETLPPWPGQSMTWSVPRMGPLVLARLHGDGGALDVYAGEGAEVRQADRVDWHRLKWLVRMDVGAFVAEAIHHHWAIARPPRGRSLELLCEELLGLALRRF